MLVTPQLVSHTLTNLDEADDDDENEREKLGCSKEVLHPGGRLHAVAVHECQQDCRRSKETSHKVTQNMQQLEDGKTTRPPAGISDAPVCSQGRSTFHSSREHDVPQCLSHNTMQAAEEFTVMEDKQHSSPLYPSVFVELHVQLLKRPQTPLKVINQSSRSFKASKSGRSPNRKTRRHNGALY